MNNSKTKSALDVSLLSKLVTVSLFVLARGSVECAAVGECEGHELVCDSTENLVHICSGAHSCAGATLRLHRADCRLLCSAEHSCENASVVYESGASALEVFCDATSACASLSVSQTRHSHTLQMDCAAADACRMALTLYSSDNCVRCLQTADACNGLSLFCEGSVARCNATSFVSNSLKPVLSCADEAVCVCGGPQPITCNSGENRHRNYSNGTVSLISAACGLCVFLVCLCALGIAREKYAWDLRVEIDRINRSTVAKRKKLDEKLSISGGSPQKVVRKTASDRRVVTEKITTKPFRAISDLETDRIAKPHGKPRCDTGAITQLSTVMEWFYKQKTMETQSVQTQEENASNEDDTEEGLSLFDEELE